MEKSSESYPQDTVDAKAPEGGMFEKFEEFESSKSCGSERGHGRRTSCGDGNLSNSSNPSNPLEPSELEARVRGECRRTCRRRLLVELFKTITKVAGVILAAMGLSSFNAED